MKPVTVRVATAGPTVDNRKIEATWLKDAAETYNTETYGARINLEHIRGLTADSPFPSLGDVLSLSTKEEEINGTETTCLYATILPNQFLLDINKKSQKIYTSIELDPNFAQTNKAYLLGIAVTDSPASLGTQALKFSLSHSSNPQTKNLYSMSIETNFNVQEKELTERVTDLLSETESSKTVENQVVATKVIAEEVTLLMNRISQLSENISELQKTFYSNKENSDELTEFKTLISSLKEDFSNLKATIEQTPVEDLPPNHDGHVVFTKENNDKPKEYIPVEL